MSSADPLSEFAAALLPESHAWDGRPTPEVLAGLPNTPAVLLFMDGAGRPVQLLTTQQLKRIAAVRLCPPEDAPPTRADLAAVVRGVRWRGVRNPFEARWWYYRLARLLHPREYRKLVGFGPAWFLHIDWGREIPEISVTERVWVQGGAAVGPWPARAAATRALEGLWDLFDLCRYPEQVRKAPHGQRCAYAEMGRCDAPCDGSAPMAAYVERCRGAWAFAQGGARAWLEDAERRMKQAAQEQRYEVAAQIKQQMEFARKWQREWQPHVRTVEDWHELALVPVTRRKAWLPIVFSRGRLESGPVTADRKIGEGVCGWLRAWQTTEPARITDVERMEQTWLYSHLLFNREAEACAFFVLPDGTLPAGLEADLAEAVKARRTRKGPEDEEQGI